VSEVRVGCSGWNYGHWRERVYPKGLPAKRWLEHYARLFDTVEINNTFYRLPQVSAVRGWVEGSPPRFLFAVKMSRYLTHIRRLAGLETGIPLFYQRIAPLARSPKLGPVLWQLPPTYKRNDERLAAALTALPDGRHCFEFRHPTWYAAEVYDLLRDRGSRLGLTSVYRALHAFAASGIVHVFPGAQQRFRICDRAPHAHLVCEECGRVIERPADSVRRWLAPAAREADFVPNVERSDVYGRCTRCHLDATHPAGADTPEIARRAGPRLDGTNENGYQDR
jgi:Fe2+ or Zn2+ uptake regulation protein